MLLKRQLSVKHKPKVVPGVLVFEDGTSKTAEV